MRRVREQADRYQRAAGASRAVATTPGNRQKLNSDWRTTINILAVEDNPLHLKLVHVVLSAAGHHVSGATAASQAMESINRERPEMIIVDLSLPDTDGLTLVSKCRSDPRATQIPVLAVTFYPV